MKNFIRNYLSITAVILFMMSSLKVEAQQDPMFTQYYFNMQTINPAYAGTWESLGFMALGRLQWVGFEGSPRTYTFSTQAPINDAAGIGLNIISDKLGKENRFSFMGDYSYRLQVSEDSYVRLGLKGGITRYSNPLTQYDTYGEILDPSLSADIESKFMPNFGVGIYWYSDEFYLGFSIPKMLENEYKSKSDKVKTLSDVRHFFLSGGYVFNLSEKLRFKPTFLVKATQGAPVEVDLSGNLLIGDKIWLGANYRAGDSFGVIAQWIFDKRLRIGYAIDFTTTELSNYHDGTHEVMISYELGSRRKWSSPRMF